MFRIFEKTMICLCWNITVATVVKNPCQQHKDGNVRLILVVWTMCSWHWQGNNGDFLLLLAQPTELSDLKSYSKHIHPSSTPASSCSQGRRDLESIPAVIGWRQGYTMDKSAVHHRATVKDKQRQRTIHSHIHTYRHFRVPNLPHMSQTPHRKAPRSRHHTQDLLAVWWQWVLWGKLFNVNRPWSIKVNGHCDTVLIISETVYW